MELRDYINTDGEYTAVEREIRDWVEQSYRGLSIEFDSHLELVQTDAKRRFTRGRVAKITEAVNAKIGELLESRAERIYIAERLERIYAKHPEFSMDAESIADVKTNPTFLRYLNELIITE